MQFFYKFGNIRKQKQKPLEAETFGTRSLWNQKPLEPETFGTRRLNLQSIDGLLESRKFEKVEGSTIVKFVKKKYFSYIIDKIVSLRRNFSKALVILSWFLLLFLLLLLLLKVYISLSFYLEVFQSELYRISIV